MKTIFLVLEQFSHYSDILRGNLIKELAKNYRVVVLTERLDSKAAHDYKFFEHQNVIYQKWQIHYGHLWNISRKYLRLPFIREYDSWLITNHWYYRKDYPLKMRVLLLIGRLLPKKFPSVEQITLLEKLIARPTSAFKKLVREYKPAAILTATPGYLFYEAEFIVFAKTLGIPTIAISINYDNPYSQAKFVRKTDYAFAWNEKMKEKIVAFHHYSPEKVKVTGCLRFDHYFTDETEGKIPSRGTFLLGKKLDPQKKTVLITGPSPIMYPKRRELAELLKDFKKSGKLHGDPNIFIRLHPHDTEAAWVSLAGEKNIHIERAGKKRVPDNATKGQKIEMEEEDLSNLTATLKYADVVLNFVSTMNIEATLFNKPLISIGFPEFAETINKYEYHVELLADCDTIVAKNPNELLELVNRFLIDFAPEAKNNLGMKQVPAIFRDGKSYKRVADEIGKILTMRHN